MNFSKEIIKKYNLKLSKKFGQNFLADETILHRIIQAAEISAEDLVLEVGPGAGALTAELVKKAGFVLGVEIDRQLIPVLNEVLGQAANLQLMEGDALEMTFSPLVKELMDRHGLKKAKLVANLPYYITTPLVFKFLEDEDVFDAHVVMVQKEVAERMVAKPGKKDYGALSVSVQYYTEPSIQFTVPPESFIPEPGVQSAVVKLSRRREPSVELADEALFFKVVKASFAQRRKTLLNTLKNNLGIPLTKEQFVDILNEIGIEPNRRGETLSLKEFASLSNKIFSTCFDYFNGNVPKMLT